MKEVDVPAAKENEVVIKVHYASAVSAFSYLNKRIFSRYSVPLP